MKFAMYQIMRIENKRCSFCLKKKKEIEYLDAHNDEGTIEELKEKIKKEIEINEK